MQLRKFSLVVLVFVAVVFSGCASFRNNEIATVDKLPDVMQFKNKPTAFIDAHLYRGERGSKASEILTNKDKVHEVIGKTVSGTNFFSKYSFNDVDKAGSDYVIKIDIYNHGNEALAFFSGFITGFTFGVVPGAAKDNFTIIMQLSDRSGTVISEVTNKDSVTTWVGLWFIPAMGNTPEKAFNGTLENQLRAALKDLVESGKIKYSHLLKLECLFS